MLNALAVILLMFSAFFFGVGTLGLLRLPDTLTRMHATTKCDTLGVGLGLLALGLYSGLSLVTVKLIVIIVFIWLTNPTAAHVIAKAAYSKEQFDIKQLGDKQRVDE